MVIVEHVQCWAERRASRRPAGEVIRTAAYDVAPIESAAAARREARKRRAEVRLFAAFWRYAAAFDPRIRAPVLASPGEAEHRRFRAWSTLGAS